MLSSLPNRRVLLVDDTPAIHQDFRRLLNGADDGTPEADLDNLEATLFGTAAAPRSPGFEVDSAFGGQEALTMVREALAAGRPYAMAFVDMRMPPGWDGVETVERVWKADPRLQVVICTAYSDHSWSRVLDRLHASDQLLILKKPFDPIEVGQLATALTAKWNTTRQAEAKLDGLERIVRERTAKLWEANEALRRELAERQRTATELTLAASVFHHALDGIVITGPLGRIISVNPAFTAITGYEPGEVLGRSAHRLWSGSWDPGVYRGIRDGLARDGRWEGAVWNRRKTGERLLMRLSISRVEEDERSARRYVCLFNDITDIRRKDERIRHLAFHDHLTGLPNQAMLIERLNESVNLARHDHEPLGIFFIDLDRFKAINDSYGHDIGNLLLKEVASRLKGCLHRSDMVARIGGDEFVVLLRRITRPKGYSGLAKRIINRLSQPTRIANRDVQVGVSIGIACFPDDGTDAIELMRHADAAMYAAKSSGRGTFRFFQASMSERIERRLRLEMELRTAVPNGELELRYQPKVSLVTGEPIGLEALIRWRHRRHGVLSPGEFLPMAEEIGLAGELEDWVLREVFRQSRDWRARGLPSAPIAVNISVEQVQRSDLTDLIISLSNRYAFPLCDLEIELTEDGVMADPEAAAGTLGRLRKLGISIAIDDFGTGYSSLAYLRRLPIDVLKIDKSFVMNTDGTPSDAEIVKTIIGLGKTLNLAVVAEGVETHEQAEFLRACGCTTAQGYLFAQPLAADEVEGWFRDRSRLIGTSQPEDS
ncbi:MAG: EAL domain-containing protein [Dactylosporangium sp.]|nr:EAL domain-containing protein [Dactylosporangium sp.]NNJ59851.1 EAL domain-containing protein [Dactylosporangium sp.]